MYKQNAIRKSKIQSVEVVEGEPIEGKIERILANKEPIKDGAPEIYTERKDGVIAAYNIRTDRWEVACEAMDAVSRSIQAKRDAAAKLAEDKLTKAVAGEKGDEKGNVGEAKPAQGKPGETGTK